MPKKNKLIAYEKCTRCRYDRQKVSSTLFAESGGTLDLIYILHSACQRAEYGQDRGVLDANDSITSALQALQNVRSDRQS